MFSEKDFKIFGEAIKQMEDSNDAFYVKQYKNLISSGLSYDDLAKLAACFYTQRYKLMKKQDKQQSLQENNSVKVIHPAYKSGVTPEIVYNTYMRCNGNKCETARLLNISIKTVYKRLKEYEDQ